MLSFRIHEFDHSVNARYLSDNARYRTYTARCLNAPLVACAVLSSIARSDIVNVYFCLLRFANFCLTHKRRPVSFIHFVHCSTGNAGFCSRASTMPTWPTTRGFSSKDFICTRSSFSRYSRKRAALHRTSLPAGVSLTHVFLLYI